MKLAFMLGVEKVAAWPDSSPTPPRTPITKVVPGGKNKPDVRRTILPRRELNTDYAGNARFLPGSADHLAEEGRDQKLMQRLRG